MNPFFCKLVEFGLSLDVIKLIILGRERQFSESLTQSAVLVLDKFIISDYVVKNMLLPHTSCY